MKNTAKAITGFDAGNSCTPNKAPWGRNILIHEITANNKTSRK
jgi:hypothetical protein